MVGKQLVTQRDEFECAYLMSVDDNLPILHAHHYRVEVTVSRNDNSVGHDVIIDFDRLRHYIRRVLPDKAFLYNGSEVGSSAENSIATEFKRFGIAVQSYLFTPSAENLAQHFATKLQSIFDFEHLGIQVVEVKLRETANSYATWSI